MNNKIIDFFRAEPPIYEKSSKAFWDDEHISKSMLAAHLDVKNKQLLDLGCGAGIYAELLYDGVKQIL